MIRLGPIAVGVLLLVGGLIKGIESRAFARHLYSFRLLPDRLLRPAVAVAVALEATLGTALVGGIAPRVAIPAAVALIAFFAAVTAWGHGSGRIRECGCYGSLVRLSPSASLAVDAIAIAALAPALVAPPPPLLPAATAALVLATILVGSALLAARPHRTTERPSSLLRAGGRWSRRWAPVDRLVSDRHHVVALLTPGCPACRRWVPVLDVVNGLDDLPPVTALAPATASEIDAFRRETGARFPIVAIRSWIFHLLAPAPPALVLLENGVISGAWLEIPEPFLRPVRDLLQTVAPENRGRDTFTG